MKSFALHPSSTSLTTTMRRSASAGKLRVRCRPILGPMLLVLLLLLCWSPVPAQSRSFGVSSSTGLVSRGLQNALANSSVLRRKFQRPGVTTAACSLSSSSSWVSSVFGKRPKQQQHETEKAVLVSGEPEVSVIPNEGTQLLTHSMTSADEVSYLMNGIDQQSEEEQVTTAFFRATGPHDVEQMHSVASAYLRTRKTRTTTSQLLPETELELLESHVHPCAKKTLFALPQSKGKQAKAAAASLKRTSSTATSTTTTATNNQIHRPLVFWENMICGAISRSIAQTVMHPANTCKTILQSSKNPPTLLELARPRNFHRLTVGAGANFLLSVPHGAINFAVLELVRTQMDARLVQKNQALQKRKAQLGPALDFLSSCISTITCSVVSTPQMVLTDNIMAGNYPNLPRAVVQLSQEQGVRGFYRGWWPGLVGKIPSYALTWTFFQQLKLAREKWLERPATDVENSIMGSMASAATVCIMIPMDTIKTRLVTQGPERTYKGIIDCAVRVYKEEGVQTFYRGLPPRLLSVVPMIGIQFGVYEFCKRVMLERRAAVDEKDQYTKMQVLKEAAMEVAASPEHPYPAPQFRDANGHKKKKRNLKEKSN